VACDAKDVQRGVGKGASFFLSREKQDEAKQRTKQKKGRHHGHRFCERSRAQLLGVVVGLLLAIALP